MFLTNFKNPPLEGGLISPGKDFMYEPSPYSQGPDVPETHVGALTIKVGDVLYNDFRFVADPTGKPGVDATKPDNDVFSVN